MNIEKLKQKILDLAITGKLFPKSEENPFALTLKDEILAEYSKNKIDDSETVQEENYSLVKINDLVVSVSPVGKEVKTKDVKPIGRFPVVSQSQNQIDGYTDEETKIISDLPIVLFGDHTRIVKYIDFNFAPGADGTKLFKAKKCFPKYLFYLAMYAASHIENRGYNRHCALFKDYKVPYFESKQKQIFVYVALDYLFGIVNKIDNNKQKINEYIEQTKKKVLEEIFINNILGLDTLDKVYSLDELLPYEQPGPYIVETTDYDDNYTTPVLTPGKTFILGYTNETTGIFKASKNNKVIIFDDFTTASRLIDFDFKVKSSAMKILSNGRPDLCSMDYLYYLLQSLNVNHDTHKRYWISVFSPMMMKIHTLESQRAIVEYITGIFKMLDHLL